MELKLDKRIIDEAVQEAVRDIKQNFIPKDVLDKIIAEVELHRRKTASIDPYDLIGDCLDIIDKYKKESDKESEE